MKQSSLKTIDGRDAFEPGETIRLVAEWKCPQKPPRAEVRLIWFTEGKGDTDRAIVRREQLDKPRATDSRTVEFKLPEAPYSFSGKFVSLVWAVRLELFGAGKSRQLDITVAPLAREVILPDVTPTREATRPLTAKQQRELDAASSDYDEDEDDELFEGPQR